MSGVSIAHGDRLDTSRQETTLAKALARSIDTFPNGKFIYLQTGEGPLSQSYASTWERAQRILQGLRREGIQPGDKLILYIHDCQDFVPTIWSCFLAGAIPVPISRVEWSRHHARTAAATLQYLRRVLDSPRIVTGQIEPRLQEQLGLEPRNTLDLQTLEKGPLEKTFFEGAPNELSLLVFTSGTTGYPHLVSLSARAVINRWWPMMPARQHARTFLSWSPLEHVMGMGFASPNVPTKVNLPTSLFVNSPASWLDNIGRFGVTHCTMTNFGMELIERQIASSPGREWDLTSIRKIGIGGEAICPRTCQRFYEVLRPLGLRSDAVILGYGLSECGPVVGGDEHFSVERVPSTSPFVVLDRPTPGHSVRIVEAQAEEKVLPECQVGAVQVRGPTMALGYFGDAEASGRLFTSDGWIRTGDLGAITNGRLTITGRQKEIIIVNAKKYSCVEIETIAQSISGVDAAYAITCVPGSERNSRDAHFVLCFVASSAALSRAALLVRILHKTISAHFGFAPEYIIPVSWDAIPRTHTGKVRRFELAARLKAGEFDDALSLSKSVARSGGHSPPSTDTERIVASIFARILGSDDFGVEDDFFDLGGDSLAAARLLLELEGAFRKPVPPKLLYECTTIARLAFFFERPSQLKSEQSSLPNITQRTYFQPTTNSRLDLHPAIERRLYALVAKWGGEGARPNSLVRGINRTGKKQPLFWCLQQDWEATQLALHLGPDQPVYAMRSGHLVMHYTSYNVSALAQRYMEEILAIEARGPYFLAGFCQGCIVAFEIARQLQQTGREVRLLTLLDFPLSELFSQDAFTATRFQLGIYPGRVALFTGLYSRFNPHRRFRSPELGWRKVFPHGLRFDLLPADHGSLFGDLVMQLFVGKLRSALDWAAEPDSANVHAVLEGPLPPTAYRADIKAPEELRMEVGSTAVVNVCVKNIGSATWHRTDQSGIMLGDHWFTPGGELIVWSDARAILPDPIGPGQAMMLDLPLRAPGEPGKYIVEIDLVEEGVTWFTEKGAASAIVHVIVSPRKSDSGLSKLARLWDAATRGML